MNPLRIRPLSQRPLSCLLRPPNLQVTGRYLPRRTYSSTSGMKSFSYRISAAFSAKQHKLDLQQNNYFHDQNSASSTSIAADIIDLSPAERKRKRYKSGQDAFFVTSISSSRSIAFAVVDGVGGWVDSGVDPADFAHRLCEYMSQDASNQTSSTPSKPLPILDYGYDHVIQDKSVPAGGSTACVAVVSPSGTLEVANLGDSGYAHFSPFRLAHLSEPQTHAFNTPFQLSKIPQHIVRQMELFGNEHFSEQPSDSDIYKHSLQHGDVFVFATDGVWDNLSPEDVLKIVSGVMAKAGAWEVDVNGGARVGKGLDQKSEVDLSTTLAMAVVREAKECSLNSKRDGPFAKEVKRQYPFENWRGGKPDDICVVVGVVVEDSKPVSAKL